MEALRYYEGKIRAADKLSIVYQVFVATVILFNYPKIPNAPYLLFFHTILVLFLLTLPWMGNSRLVNWLRLWNLVPIILFNFSELHFIVHNVRPNDLDAILIKLDYALFGVHPTVWLEKLYHPLIADYLQLVYTSFYFLPLILAVLLYRQGRMKEFDYFALIVVYGFYSSYIGYFLVPAIGPRFTLSHLQSFPIYGVFVAEPLQKLLNTLENIQRDAFPSGHTEITLLTMYFAHKYHKKYFYVLLVIGTSLIISTVYLRYHYVVDVIGGALFALFVIKTAPALYKALNAIPILNLRSEQEWSS